MVCGTLCDGVGPSHATVRPAKELIVFACYVHAPQSQLRFTVGSSQSKERQCGLRRRGAPTPSIYFASIFIRMRSRTRNSRSWYMVRVRYGTYRSVGTIIPTPTGMSEYYDETVFSAVISDVLALLAGPRGLSRSRTVGSGEGRGEGATPVSAPRVLRPHSCSHIALYSSRRLARHRRRIGGCRMGGCG